MTDYVIAIPHYANEHTLFLKVIDFVGLKRFITVKINGI